MRLVFGVIVAGLTVGCQSSQRFTLANRTERDRQRELQQPRDPLRVPDAPTGYAAGGCESGGCQNPFGRSPAVADIQAPSPFVGETAQAYQSPTGSSVPMIAMPTLPRATGLPAGGGLELAGKIVNSYGRPEPAASIQVKDLRSGRVIAQSASDLEGAFKVSNLQAGQRYELQASSAQGGVRQLGSAFAVAPDTAVVVQLQGEGQVPSDLSSTSPVRSRVPLPLGDPPVTTPVSVNPVLPTPNPYPSPSLASTRPGQTQVSTPPILGGPIRLPTGPQGSPPLLPSSPVPAQPLLPSVPTGIAQPNGFSNLNIMTPPIISNPQPPAGQWTPVGQ